MQSWKRPWPLTNKLTAGGAERAQELKRFDEEATRALSLFFPGIELHLDTPVPTVRDLFGEGTIKVSERGREAIRDFTAFGHGAQRSIQMALIRYLAEVRAGETDTAQRRLLLIEEPELFLHPQAIEQVRTALESLSEHGYQVVFATHSPVMVEREAVARTRIIRKDLDTGETRIMPTAEEALAARNPEEDKRLLTLFALENTSYWLFSDRVLIGEGATERHLLPAVYEAVAGRNSADDGLAILALGGGSSLPNSLALFRDWSARPQAWPLADALHHKLRAHHIWLWTGGDIEHHLDLASGKKDITTWAPFKKRLEHEPYQALSVKEHVTRTYATSNVSVDNDSSTFCGFNVTGPTGCQFRVSPDQRSGRCCRACS